MFEIEKSEKSKAKKKPHKLKVKKKTKKVNITKKSRDFIKRAKAKRSTKEIT